MISRLELSKIGPGNKGILKPDLLGPGSQIISAKSHSHSNYPHGCGENNDSDYFIMSGTSMAVPNIAGAEALIREYFQSGKWIDKVDIDGPTTKKITSYTLIS